jgi:hypothetical protein
LTVVRPNYHRRVRRTIPFAISMCYNKQNSALEHHEKNDPMGCDSDYWLGSLPSHLVNCLEEEASRRIGQRAATTLLDST